jgi:hypothetical protein
MTSPVTPQWSWVRVFDFLGVNGGVMHGLGIESLTFGGQWWCSVWSWVRIFDFWGSMVVKCMVVGSNI